MKELAPEIEQDTIKEVEIDGLDYELFNCGLSRDEFEGLELALTEMDGEIDDIIEIESVDSGDLYITRKEQSDLIYSIETGTVAEFKGKPKRNHFTSEEQDLIAAENINLVHFVISRLHSPKVQYDELFGVGMFGYAKAIKSYDQNVPVKFSTYAVNCIRNEILYYLRKENKYLNKTSSLNRGISTRKGEGEVSLEEALPDESLGPNSLQASALTKEEQEMISRALTFLTEQERFVIVYRFGLDAGKILTQKEISERIEMSQANVSKIQRNALSKLRSILHKEIDYSEFI